MSKKKVLFISAANSIHTIKWVNALSEEYEVHLAYCKNHQSNMDTINKNVYLHELTFTAPIGYYLNAFSIKKVYKNVLPDIVNVHYASGYGTLARISKIRPTLISVWGSDVYEFPNKSNLKRKILQKNIMYAENIASTSNAMAIELKKQVPMLKKNIYITPFGVDIEKFKKNNNNRENKNFNIGIVKTLKKIYGVKYAILAIKLLKDKLKNSNEVELADSIKLYIYGDGEEKKYLEELIRQENLNDSVFLMGKISNDQVPNVLNSFDVFLATSNNESFGVAVIEAMSCELPVIATDVDGFKEVMEDGKTGFIVEKKNVGQIANALEQIVRDKIQAKQMGINGRKRVIQNYNWQENVKYMSDIYKKIIDT